jgi:putative restriction endonuclease
MNGFVGITDNDWFGFLSHQPGIDEVNFWQPAGRSQFKSLQSGEPFLFKLHKPYERYIAGGGFFAHYTTLPISLAWQTFEEKNGASSYLKMRQLIEKHRHVESQFEDYKIGCIILTQPFFFPRDQWVTIPPDFSLNIVQGKTYDFEQGHGARLWQKVELILQSMGHSFGEELKVAEIDRPPYGKPITVLPRLGQGSFRVIVTDAYERRCAITEEKALPTLEAAHIKPFSQEGPHSVDNGILLRSDFHRLLDAGYATVTTDHHFEVSRRIHDEFDNGEYYYTFHGKRLHVPPNEQYQPSTEFLTWHNENIFRG